MIIDQVEQAILSAVTDNQPGLNKLGSLPGSWTMDTLKSAIQFAPGVYVSFLGGANTDYKKSVINGKFDVYIVNKSAIESKRRKAEVTGAYALVESLIPILHKLQISGVGVLNLKQVNNLFKEHLFNMGASVYALTFEIDLVFEAEPLAEPSSKVLDFSLNGTTQVVVS